VTHLRRRLRHRLLTHEQKLLRLVDLLLVLGVLCTVGLASSVLLLTSH
jgi:hypothetical protein